MTRGRQVMMVRFDASCRLARQVQQLTASNDRFGKARPLAGLSGRKGDWVHTGWPPIIGSGVTSPPGTFEQGDVAQGLTGEPKEAGCHERTA